MIPLGPPSPLAHPFRLSPSEEEAPAAAEMQNNKPTASLRISFSCLATNTDRNNSPKRKKKWEKHTEYTPPPLPAMPPLTFGLLGGCLCRRLGRGLALVQCSSFSPAVGRSIRNPVAVAGCVAGSEPLAGSASFVEAGRAGGAAGLSDGGAR